MAERIPKFHHFDEAQWDVDDVLPGDYVIAPGTLAFQFDESRSEENVMCYTLALRPFAIISVEVIDGDADQKLKYKYHVLSRHGILVILKARQEQ